MNYLQKELYDRIKSDPEIFDFLQHSSLDGLWYWDLTAPEEEWMNERFWETLGYDPAEMPHKAAAWQNIIFPEDLEIAKENVGRHLGDPDFPYDQIVRYIHKEGHTVYIHCKGLAIRDENGAPIRMLGAHTDVTELYQKQLMLEESASLARVGSWQVNIPTENVWWSKTTKEIHEVPSDFEPNLETGISFYKEGYHRDKIAKVVQRAMEEGGGWDEELVIVTATGKERWIRAVGKVEFVGGKPVRVYGVFQDIDDRKRAEQRLERSEEQFRKVFDLGTVGMAIFNSRGELIRINETYASIIGIPSEELIGTPFTELIHPDDLEKELQIFGEIMAGTEDSRKIEFRLQTTSRGTRNMEGGVTVLRNSEGEAENLIVQVQDVTERKQAVEQLYRSEERFRKVFELGSVMMIIVDTEGKFVQANDAFTKLLQHTPEECVGRHFTQLLAPSDLEKGIALFEEVSSGEVEKMNIDIGLRSRTGKLFDMEGGVTVLYDQKKQPNLFIFQAQDVTERNRAMKRLARSEEQFRTVFESAAIGMAILNEQNEYIGVNRAYRTILEAPTRELLIGMEFSDVVVIDNEESREEINDFLNHNTRRNQAQIEIVTLKRKKRQVLIDLIPMKNVMNDRGQYLLQMRDITESVTARNRLERERKFLQTLIDNIPINVYVKDLQSRKTLVNSAELRHMGAEDPDDLLGKSDYELFPKWSADLSRQEDIEVFTTGKAIINHETTNPDAQGNIQHFLSSKIPLLDENEKITGLLGLSYNVTSDRLAQDRLRQLSILESKSQEMEQFAYIASHDLREPLLTIKGYSDVLLEDFRDILGEEGMSYLRAIIRGATRMDDLIKGMLDYSRLAQVKEFEPVDIRALIGEVVEDMKLRIEQNDASILIGDLPILPGNRLRLKQLFQNLIANGIKFRKTEVEPEIKITSRQIAGGYEFSVLDNGIGISEKDYDKIFSLFKQLHRRNKDDGTGIGLANCKKVVEMHNGEIWVESKEYEYANFIFTLKTL